LYRTLYGVSANVSTDNRRRTALSREAIAAAALGLVDEVGLDQLSMRRLASHLDIGTMTLYGYFRDKGELLAALVDAAADEEPEWDRATGDWRAQVAHVARALRGGLERHPSLVQLRLRRPILTPGALRGTEVAMRALLDAGLPRADAARAFRSLFLYTFGFVAFSAGGPPDELRRQARAALADLSAGEFPTLHASVDEMAETLSGDEQFEFGLAQLLDGVQARIPG
jgi:AcrR family transcriptional regulator